MSEFERPRYPYMGPMAQYGLDRSLPLQFSGAVRPDPRSCPTARAGRQPTNREFEQDTQNGQPRRRVAVACARCRKRKIRCSGDPGNGTGCQNCKQSGADINGCQFHRVGSQEPPVAMAQAAASGLSYGLRSMVHGSSFGYSTYPPTYSTGAYSTPYTTLSFQSPSWPSYQDDSPTESYGSQSMNYMANPENSSEVFNTAEILRQFSFNPVSRSQSISGRGILFDTSPPSYNTNQLSYVTQSMMSKPGPATTENTTAFGMNALHSSLPTTLGDRHLPVPIGVRTPSTLPLNPGRPRLAMGYQQSQDLSADDLSSGATYTKAAMNWNPINMANNGKSAPTGSQGSTGNLSSGESVVVGTPSSSSPTSSGPDLSLGYYQVTVTDSPNSSPTTAVASANYGTASQEAAPPMVTSDYSGVPTVRMTEMPSTSSILSRRDSSSNHYSFTTDSSTKSSSLGQNTSAESTLISGQRYAPLVQPQPQHAPSLEQLRQSIVDQSPTQPPPIASRF